MPRPIRYILQFFDPVRQTFVQFDRRRDVSWAFLDAALDAAAAKDPADFSLLPADIGHMLDIAIMHEVAFAAGMFPCAVCGTPGATREYSKVMIELPAGQLIVFGMSQPRCERCVENDARFSDHFESCELRLKMGESILDIAARPGANVVSPDPRDLLLVNGASVGGTESSIIAKHTTLVYFPRHLQPSPSAESARRALDITTDPISKRFEKRFVQTFLDEKRGDLRCVGCNAPTRRDLVFPYFTRIDHYNPEFCCVALFNFIAICDMGSKRCLRKADKVHRARLAAELENEAFKKRLCIYCRKAESDGKDGGNVVKVKWCSKCRGPTYCSVECQLAHWPQHKPDCKVLQNSD